VIYFICRKRNIKAIGVLGGMGPESTALFYLSLIKQCQKQYGAKFDGDYPEIFIYNLPIPDVVEGIKKPSETLACLVRGVKKLEAAGADFLVMPCNTATYFYKAVLKEISIPFLSIVAETAKEIRLRNCKKAGLLATKTVVENKVYEEDFKKFGLELMVPKEPEKVNQVILNILAGKKLEKDKETLKTIAKELEKRGAEAIVLGCTDLPIILKQKDLDIRVFDSLEVLAKSTIEFAIG
jgi:aspartate racemase